MKLTRVLVALYCFCAVMPLAARAAGQAATDKAATTPAQGSPERKALLDAVRARWKIKSQFKVYHLKASGDWAYCDGGEVVVLGAGDGALQETDIN